MRNYSRKTSVWAVVGILVCALIWVLRPGLAAEKKAVAETKPKVSLFRMLNKLWRWPGSFYGGEVKLVALRGKALYVAGSPRGLDAIDVKSGMPRWQFIGELPLDTLPVERGNVLYLVEGGQFVTVNKTNGMELSRRHTRIGAMTPLFPGEGAWMVGSTDSRIYVVMPETGLKAWRSERIDNYIVSSAWDGKDEGYFLSASGTLYSASVATRQLGWQHRFPKPACGPLLLAGQTIYVGCADYYLYALDAGSGTVRWRICLSAPVLGTPLATKSRVYVSTRENVLYAVDVASPKKEIAWRINGAERVITATPEHVVFLRRRAKEYVLGMADAKTGELISEQAVPQYTFFAADPESGIFYGVTKHGTVDAYAVRTSSEKAR